MNIQVIIKAGVGYWWQEDGCNMCVVDLPDDFPVPRIGEMLKISETIELDVSEQIGELKIPRKMVTEEYIVTGIERWYNKDNGVWGIDICVTPVATSLNQMR